MHHDDIIEWRRSIDTTHQPDFGDCVVDCDLSSDSTTLTPERPTLRLVCPDAPRKRKRLYLSSQGSQTDLTVGPQTLKGATLQCYSIDYACHSCHVLQFSDRPCRFCGEPTQRNVGTQVGLYHLVPYFE